MFLGQLGLGACLADDMGQGKTAQLIASLLADPLEAPTLVVAPVSLLGDWQRELERFAPGLKLALHHGPERPRTLAALRRSLKALGPGGVLIASYGVLSRDAALLAKLDWGRLVFDEAQQLKNPYTAVSRAAAGLRAERRVALTGTPAENRLLELWALLQLLNPGLLCSLAQFRQRFALPIERDRDPEAAERLRRLTAPFLLRRLKSDPTILPDLPGRIEQTELCTLSEEQATLYRWWPMSCWSWRSRARASPARGWCWRASPGSSRCVTTPPTTSTTAQRWRAAPASSAAASSCWRRFSRPASGR